MTILQTTDIHGQPLSHQECLRREAHGRAGGWVLRFSGMQMTLNANAPKGRRAQSMTLGSQPLNQTRTYPLAACQRTGEPIHLLCLMPYAQDPQVMLYTVHAVPEEYLKKKGTVAPRVDGRAQALDLSAPLLAQLPNVDYVFR